MISADVDGEATAQESAAVRRHVRTCAGCRKWQHDISDLAQVLRGPPVQPGHVDDQFLRVVVEAAPSRHRWRTLRNPIRLMLVVIGVAQVAWGLADIVALQVAPRWLSPTDREGFAHLSNESAAWNVAIGVGFLCTAFGQVAASGALPMITTFMALVIASSAHDAAEHHVHVVRESIHVLLMVGYVLSVRLWWRTTTARNRPRHLVDAPNRGVPKLRLVRDRTGNSGP